MKRTLAVVIDANRVTCGKCEHKSLWVNWWCKLFDVGPMKHSGNAEVRLGDGLLRCAPCLAAEKEAT